MIDSHAHLDMLPDLDAALSRASDAGVDRVITIGVDLASSEWAAALNRESVWATVGLHPHDAKDSSPAALAHLEELAAAARVVGVGETGLDYYYDNSPRERQREVFAAQIDLAARVDKALVIHTRDAWDDTYAIMRSRPLPSNVVFHCWSGGPAEAETALGLGSYLSFSGIVTFPNASALREAAAITPLDRMLIETDSPFLAPVPHRGRKNEPAYVVHTASFLSELKGADVAAASTANAERAFGL